MEDTPENPVTIEFAMKEKMDNELDAMKSRIAGAQDLLKTMPELEGEVDSTIEAALRSKSHEELLKHIEALADALSPAINESALHQLKRAHLYPVPPWGLP